MLNRDLGEFLKNLPGSGGVDIIIEDDFADLPKKCSLIQIVQGGIKFIGVCVLTVHDDCCPIASLQEVIDSVFGYEPCICDLAHVREVVLMVLIEEPDEFLIVI